MNQRTLVGISMLLVGAFWLCPLVCRADEKAQTTKNMMIKGRIAAVNVDANQLTVRTKDGRELNFSIDEQSKLFHLQQQVKLSRFHVGQRVRVEYEFKDAKYRAVAIAWPPVVLADIKKEVGQALESAKEFSFQQKAEYQRKLEPVLRHLDERIEELKEQSQEASGAVRQKYHQEIQALQQKREAVGEKVGHARVATAQAWEDAKSAAGRAIEELNQAIDQARGKMTPPASPPPSDRP